MWIWCTPLCTRSTFTLPGPCPRPWLALGEVEDDLLGLDLAVVVGQVHPRAGSRCPVAERAARHRQAEQQQRVTVVPSAGQYLHAAGHDRLGIGVQALHVLVRAGEIGVGWIGGGRGDPDPHLGREHAARLVEVVVAPALAVRAGAGDGPGSASIRTWLSRATARRWSATSHRPGSGTRPRSLAPPPNSSWWSGSPGRSRQPAWMASSRCSPRTPG